MTGHLSSGGEECSPTNSTSDLSEEHSNLFVAQRMCHGRIAVVVWGVFSSAACRGGLYSLPKGETVADGKYLDVLKDQMIDSYTVH